MRVDRKADRAEENKRKHGKIRYSSGWFDHIWNFGIVRAYCKKRLGIFEKVRWQVWYCDRACFFVVGFYRQKANSSWRTENRKSIGICRLSENCIRRSKADFSNAGHGNRSGRYCQRIYCGWVKSVSGKKRCQKCSDRSGRQCLMYREERSKNTVSYWHPTAICRSEWNDCCGFGWWIINCFVRHLRTIF